MYTEELLFNQNRNAHRSQAAGNYKRERYDKEKITSVCPSSRHLADKWQEDDREILMFVNLVWFESWH